MKPLTRHPNTLEAILLDAIAYRKGTTMNLSPRAAQQLRNLDPQGVAVILDCLRDHQYPKGASTLEISTLSTTYRAFVGRHKSGELVLLSVVETRPRAP